MGKMNKSNYSGEDIVVAIQNLFNGIDALTVSVKDIDKDMCNSVKLMVKTLLTRGMFYKFNVSGSKQLHPHEVLDNLFDWNDLEVIIKEDTKDDNLVEEIFVSSKLAMEIVYRALRDRSETLSSESDSESQTFKHMTEADVDKLEKAGLEVPAAVREAIAEGSDVTIVLKKSRDNIDKSDRDEGVTGRGGEA